MVFGQEAAEQLSRELLGGYNLNTRLLALLNQRPLDSRGQEAAVAMIQELSGVFRNLMVSLFMLGSGDPNGVVEVRTASPEPTICTEGSVDQRTPVKDKRISGEGLTPPRRVRGELVTNEITASPFKDSYQWRKYGQKNIQNREFPRLYYRCMYSHDRGCRAKKLVQQQDNSSHSSPIYQVTYVNEHTCHQVLPKQNISAPPTLTPTDKNISTTRSSHFDHRPQHHVADTDVELENNIMTWTLRTVIDGAAPPSPPPLEASLNDPAMSYVPDGSGHAPSLLYVSMGLDGSRFPLVEEPAAPSSLSSLPPPLPVETNSSYPASGRNLPSMDAMTMEEMDFMCGTLFSPVATQPIRHWGNVPMADARLRDTASSWPQYS